MSAADLFTNAEEPPKAEPTLTAVPDADAARRHAGLQQLARALFDDAGPTITRLVQHGRDPDTATFTLWLEHPDTDRLTLTLDQLMSRPAVNKQVLARLTVTAKPMKAADWQEIIATCIRQAVEHATSSDDPDLQAADWVRRYLDHEGAQKLDGDERDTAIRGRQPWRDDTHIHLVADKLATFARQSLGIRDATDRSIGKTLVAAGWERTQHNYRDHSRLDSQGRPLRTQARYLSAPIALIWGD